MSRKWIIILAVLLIGSMLTVAGGIGGYFWYKAYSLREMLSIGEYSYEHENWTQARAAYAHYLRRRPENVDVLLKFAASSLNIPEDRPSMLRDALISYNQITRVQPGNVEAMKRLILHCERMNAWGDLEYYSNQFITRYPQETWLNYYHALALDMLNRNQDAIEEYKALLEQGTDHDDVYFRLALQLHQTTSPEAAATLLEDAVQANTDPARILAQRALYRLEFDEVEGAQADLDQAVGVEVTPETVDESFLFPLARLAEAKQDWELAIELGNRKLSKVPDDRETYALILRVYQQENRHDEAIALLDGMDPLFLLDNLQFLLFFHDLLTMTDQYDRAETVLDTFTAAYPRNLMLAEYMRGRALLAEGNTGGAADKFTTVVENMPGFRQAHYFLAVSLLQSNQRRRARSSLEVFLRAFPDDEQGRALFEQEFSTRESSEKTFAEAEQLLQQNNAGPNEIVYALEQLVTQSLQSDDPQQAQTVRDLLKKAIKRDPSQGGPYILLIDFLLRKNDVEAARAIIDEYYAQIDAPKNGLLMRAWLNLAEGDEAGALQAFETSFVDKESPLAFVRLWANSFAARDKLDAGIALLNLAISKLPPEEAAKLRADTVSISARFGELDRALAALASLEAATGNLSADDSSLIASKEQLALLLLRSDAPGHSAEGKRLVDSLRAARPKEERFQLLEVEALLLQSPPDFEGGREKLNLMLEANPQNTKVLSAMTRLSLEEGNLIAALESARRATAAAPLDATLHLILAEVQLRDKRFSEAQATLEHSLTLEPDNTQALELLFNAYLATGRLEHAEGALAHLEGLIKNTESSWNIALMRGRLLAARGQNMDSIEGMFRERYVRNPDDMETLRQLAMVVARQGRDMETEQLLRGYAENHPENEAAWVMLGQYHLAKNDPYNQRKASSAFMRALILDSTNTDALRGMINLNFNAKNLSQILILCDRFLEAHPATPDILYRKAIILEKYKNDIPGAMAVIEQALAYDRRMEYLHLRGRLHLAQERYEDALKDFQEVGRMQDVNSLALDMSLAEAYLGLKQIEMATRYYEAAQRKMDNGAAGDAGQLQHIAEQIEAENRGTE